MFSFTAQFACRPRRSTGRHKQDTICARPACVSYLGNCCVAYTHPRVMLLCSVSYSLRGFFYIWRFFSGYLEIVLPFSGNVLAMETQFIFPELSCLWRWGILLEMPVPTRNKYFRRYLVHVNPMLKRASAVLLN